MKSFFWRKSWPTIYIPDILTLSLKTLWAKMFPQRCIGTQMQLTQINSHAKKALQSRLSFQRQTRIIYEVLNTLNSHSERIERTPQFPEYFSGSGWDLCRCGVEWWCCRYIKGVLWCSADCESLRLTLWGMKWDPIWPTYPYVCCSFRLLWIRCSRCQSLCGYPMLMFNDNMIDFRELGRSAFVKGD